MVLSSGIFLLSEDCDAMLVQIDRIIGVKGARVGGRLKCNWIADG